MKKLLGYFVGGVVGLFILFGLLWAFNYGWQKHDYYSCLQWQRDAKVYEGYYLTQSQKAQCDYFGVEVAAPVKSYSEINN